MKSLFLLFLCFILVSELTAQTNGVDAYDVTQIEVQDPEEQAMDDYDSTEENQENNYDDEEIDSLFISADSMDALRNREDFAYMENLDSILRSMTVDIYNVPEEPASKSIFDIGLVRILSWGLAIFAVLYLLYQLLAGQGSLFTKNKKLFTGIEDEDQLQAGVSPLILAQQAAFRGDYRHAIRHHYAYILELMGEQQIIKQQPQKTDDQYLDEVRHRPFASEFARLTLQYEYVWYGEFNLRKEQYEAIEGGYQKFISSWL